MSKIDLEDDSLTISDMSVKQLAVRLYLMNFTHYIGDDFPVARSQHFSRSVPKTYINMAKWIKEHV